MSGKKTKKDTAGYRIEAPMIEMRKIIEEVRISVDVIGEFKMEFDGGVYDTYPLPHTGGRFCQR